MGNSLSRQRLAAFAAAATALSVLGAACGSDDDGSGSGTTRSLADFCEAVVVVDTAFAAGGPAGPDPEAAEAAVLAARDKAPTEISEAVDGAVALTQKFLAAPDGDLSDADFAELERHNAEIDGYVLANCGFGELPVTGVDYAYQGIPGTVNAGPQALTFTNASATGEAHEAIVLRKNDGVTESFAELLAGDPEEALSKVTIAGAAFVEERGGSDTTFVDLRRGEYVMVCFVPVGSTPGAEPDESVPPHLARGMISQFTVT